MLVLTREVGERIVIGDNIVIEFRALIKGNKVRLGIEAPRDVSIMREELYLREKNKEKKDGPDHQSS